MYEGKLDVKSEFVVPLMAQADYYVIDQLYEALKTNPHLFSSQQCHEFIKQHLTKHQNVVQVLESAILHHQYNLIDKCENVNDSQTDNYRCLKLIAANFLHMHNEDYSFMSFDLFHKLLNHDRLAVKDEWLLYLVSKCCHLFLTLQTVTNYCQTKLNELSKEQIQSLMECVRFR